MNFLVRRTRRLYLGTVVSRVTATRTDLAIRLETTCVDGGVERRDKRGGG